MRMRSEFLRVKMHTSVFSFSIRDRGGLYCIISWVWNILELKIFNV